MRCAISSMLGYSASGTKAGRLGQRGAKLGRSGGMRGAHRLAPPEKMPWAFPDFSSKADDISDSV
jgi:hypothetical protein